MGTRLVMGADQSALIDEARFNPQLQRQLYDQSVGKNSPSFFITSGWLNQWLAYTDGSSKRRPGPIDNSKLFVFGTVLRPDLEHKTDYCRINAEKWHMLLGWYGGGPRISRWHNSIYGPPDPVCDAYWDL